MGFSLRHIFNRIFRISPPKTRPHCGVVPIFGRGMYPYRDGVVQPRVKDRKPWIQSCPACGSLFETKLIRKFCVQEQCRRARARVHWRDCQRRKRGTKPRECPVCLRVGIYGNKITCGQEKCKETLLLSRKTHPRVRRCVVCTRAFLSIRPKKTCGEVCKQTLRKECIERRRPTQRTCQRCKKPFNKIFGLREMRKFCSEACRAVGNE